ncbi:uncharacterized protein LOC110719736 [Chenopodium quinoa]|uniref:uncharacterized protein LOC110719736 n=1 Tax=Chenopodium quinoa TaxID=63459 RepID=UPI000B7927FD|nr:uncharacterized protein LOC110719736 [Chenopodium quinoa]
MRMSTSIKRDWLQKGFRKIHGNDYEETFSPLAMLKSIRILLAIVAYYDYEILQIVVETAFLNGFLIRNKQLVDILLTEDSKIFLLECVERTTYKQALASLNSEKWLEAMKSEMDSMSKNGVLKPSRLA